MIPGNLRNVNILGIHDLKIKDNVAYKSGFVLNIGAVNSRSPSGEFGVGSADADEPVQYQMLLLDGGIVPDI